jgi:hypothetical protein
LLESEVSRLFIAKYKKRVMVYMVMQ